MSLKFNGTEIPQIYGKILYNGTPLKKLDSTLAGSGSTPWFGYRQVIERYKTGQQTFLSTSSTTDIIYFFTYTAELNAPPGEPTFSWNKRIPAKVTTKSPSGFNTYIKNKSWQTNKLTITIEPNVVDSNTEDSIITIKYYSKDAKVYDIVGTDPITIDHF